MKLEIKNDKPIVLIKVYTTDPNPKVGRIIELSLIKYDINGEGTEALRRFNPESEFDSSLVCTNGLQTSDVEKHPSFKKTASGILDFLKGCDFVGFNIREDIKFLSEEFSRSGLRYSSHGRKFIDLNEYYKHLDERSFDNAVTRYTLGYTDDKDDSLMYLYHSISLFNGMREHENDGLGPADEDTFEKLSKDYDVHSGSVDTEGLVVLCSEELRPMFSTGVHENELVADVIMNDETYIQSLLISRSVSEETKGVIKGIYRKVAEHTK